MQNKVRVSFLIVNFNTELLVKNLCESIINFIHDYSFEILIWDNSTETAILKNKISQRENLSIFSNNENLGFVKANNLLAKNSKGEILVFINPDTELIDNSIEFGLSFFEKTLDAGVIGPQLLYPDNTKQLSYFNFPRIWDTTIEHLISSKMKSMFESILFNSTSIKKVEVIRGTCMIVSKEIFESLGGLNEKLFMFSEETDLCYRIKKKGYSNYFVPQFRIIHHESKSFGNDNFRLKYHYFRSKIIFVKNNYSNLKSKIIVHLIKLGLTSRILKSKIFANGSKSEEIFEILSKLRSEKLIK